MAGAVLVTVSVAALIYGLSQGQQNGFAAPETLIALAAAVLLGAAFVVVERRVAAPMVPVRVLADPSRRVALATMFLVGAVMVAYVYFVTLYMQRALGFSALRAGLCLLPATLTVLVTSMFLARRVAARLGDRGVLVVGLVSLGLGQVWLAHAGQPRLLPGQRAGRDPALGVRHGAAVPVPVGAGHRAGLARATAAWPAACSSPPSRSAWPSASPSWPPWPPPRPATRTAPPWSPWSAATAWPSGSPPASWLPPWLGVLIFLRHRPADRDA